MEPFGCQSLSHGHGLGGHCNPIELFCLTWKAQEYVATAINMRSIDLNEQIITNADADIIFSSLSRKLLWDQSAR